MIFHIAQYFHEQASWLNLFHYVSVRAMAALLSALFFAFIGGSSFIKFSQRHFRSRVRDWTPETHQSKNNTPTMGGLFVLIIFIINTLLWNNLATPLPWIFLACIVSFGALGFFDDWCKIHTSKGILAYQKFFLQFTSALLVCSSWYFFCRPNTQLCIPFFKNFMPELGIFIIPWAAFIIIATSNAVNLTDGLDGLATGPLIMNFSLFGIIAYLAGHKKFAAYLYIPFAGSAELAIIAATLVGALLGFLWYNTHPAEIFMGDVGSLPLGASLGLLAITSRQELLLILGGGIFVLETASVIMQVTSFRYTGKRIFRMAPIHHHFELLGWKETKVTVRFWIISFVLALLALLTLKIR